MGLCRICAGCKGPKRDGAKQASDSSNVARVDNPNTPTGLGSYEHKVWHAWTQLCEQSRHTHVEKCAMEVLKKSRRLRSSEITLVFIDLYHESTLVLIYSTVFPPPPPHHITPDEPPQNHTHCTSCCPVAPHTPNQSVLLLLTSCAVCVA